MTLTARSGWRPGWAGLAWALWVLTLLGLAATAWLDYLLRQAGRPELAQLTGGGGVTLVLAAVSAATSGTILASRRPRHPVGWLLLAFGLVWALTSAAEGYARYGLLARPGALPAASYSAMLASATFIPGLGCIGFVLLLTPTGSLPSSRWRWWAWIAAAVPALFVVAWLLGMPAVDPESVLRGVPNPLAIPILEGPLRVVAGVTAPLTALTVVVAGWSLVRRFRRARGTERQQLRWLSFAAALAPPTVLVMYAGILTENLELAGWAVGLFLALLPLAICAAIVRYRLYDLDRIISRTLAYGLLTVLLGGGYAVVVLGLGQLLGRDSPLVVAGATLAVAAVFQPARRRIQQAVDRRFNRRRHDAANSIAAFSARLRDELDLDMLSSELLAVVDQTMQPIRVSLWLQPERQAMTTRTTLTLRRTWSVAAAGMLVPVLALAAPAAAQAPPACGEQAPTIVGSNGADLLVGTPGDDAIVGLGGRDVIVGKDGNDLVCGGGDRDLVSGNDGDDYVDGGGDDVVAFAAAGDDRLDGGPGDDTVQGGQGDDRLSGGPGNDSLGTPVDVDVEEGDDRLLGGPGDDGLDGGPGFDRLNGQAGLDSCMNGEVLLSCETTAAAGRPLATVARARAAIGYGRQ